MSRRYIRWCRRGCATGSIRLAAGAHSARDVIADIGANASANTEAEHRNEVGRLRSLRAEEGLTSRESTKDFSPMPREKLPRRLGALDAG